VDVTERRTEPLDADPDAELEANELDLTPRTSSASSASLRRRSRAQKVKVFALLGAVLVAGGFVMFQGLANATTYFCNADEVGVKSSCMPEDRFRLQGTAISESVRVEGDVTAFTVAFNGAEVPVRHIGDPPELFQQGVDNGGIAVVLEGSMVSDTFESTRMLVKHSEEYVEANPDRVSEPSSGSGEQGAP
jgi:cytochrome c-type biogenesis protein CcmE